MQPPDNVTQRLHNLQVTIPRNCATSGFVTRKSLRKKPFFVNIYAKTKYFSKIILGVTQVLMYYLLIDVKNQSLKISCYCPFKENKFASSPCNTADPHSANFSQKRAKIFFSSSRSIWVPTKNAEFYTDSKSEDKIEKNACQKKHSFDNNLSK